MQHLLHFPCRTGSRRQPNGVHVLAPSGVEALRTELGEPDLTLGYQNVDGLRERLKLWKQSENRKHCCLNATLPPDVLALFEPPSDWLARHCESRISSNTHMRFFRLMQSPTFTPPATQKHTTFLPRRTKLPKRHLPVC